MILTCCDLLRWMGVCNFCVTGGVQKPPLGIISGLRVLIDTAGDTFRISRLTGGLSDAYLGGSVG